jgi:hypothetical protein
MAQSGQLLQKYLMYLKRQSDQLHQYFPEDLVVQLIQCLLLVLEDQSAQLGQ